MSIQFACPKCGQKLTLTASRPGDWLDCPGCEATIQIPGGPAPAPKPKPALAHPARGERLDFPDDDPPARRAGPVLVAVAVGLAALAVVAVVALVVLRDPQKPAEPATPQAAVPTPPPPVQPPVAPPPAAPPVVPNGPPMPAPPESTQPELANIEITQTKPRTLKLGVNTKGYDDVGAILKSLGKGYAYTELTPADLASADRLKQYDVVFLNCGGPPSSPQVLRDFVAAGKSLYASDLQFDLIAKTFPDAVDPKLRYQGTRGTYDAEVLDQGLQELLGKTVPLTFNLDGWQAAAFSGQSVTPILRATDNGRLKKGTPLLVKFGHGQSGTVFFTSFHNSVIASDTAKKLLRYLVFSAVIADAEGRVLKVLKRNDFTLKPPELLTAADETFKTTRTHTLKKDGLFRVGVGFNNEGAEIKLVIEGPGGVKFEKTGKDAFIVEVRNATVGEWKLTLSTEKLPYPNFPMTLVVAELK